MRHQTARCSVTHHRAEDLQLKWCEQLYTWDLSLVWRRRYSPCGSIPGTNNNIIINNTLNVIHVCVCVFVCGIACLGLWQSMN